MKTTPEHDLKIAQLKFSSVYPHYVQKVTKKGRTEAELLQVIHWLTGFDENMLNYIKDQQWTYEEFFAKATLHPHCTKITGVICGYKIQEIETPLTRNVRYLDKLVDELAKGKPLDKILRK